MSEGVVFDTTKEFDMELYKDLPKVTVYLATDMEEPLAEFLMDLKAIDDVKLNEILVEELCVKDGPFCSHCIGTNISFEITRRECGHAIRISPLQNGKPMTLYGVKIDETIKDTK